MSLAGVSLWPVAVNYCDNQIFVITLDSGYDVALVLVDGLPVTLTSLLQAGGSYFYTFENVTDDHDIHVAFVEVSEE